MIATSDFDALIKPGQDIDLRRPRTFAATGFTDGVALGQVVQTILLWSDRAFTDRSALGQLADGRVVLRPDIGALIRAAYDPVLPAMSRDPAHALRLAARLQAPS